MEKLTLTLEDERVRQLCLTDKKMNDLIHKIGPISISLNKNYYGSTVKRIIGQQLSVKAARTIANRVEARWENFEPEALLYIKDEELRSLGMSKAKVNYVRDLANKVLTNKIEFDKLVYMEDDEVIKELTKVKGIGVWTAEMFLIFSLGRLNVLSKNDVSIQNAVSWLYGIEKVEPLYLDLLYQRWTPFNTIASLYLWAAIDNGLIRGNPNGF